MNRLIAMPAALLCFGALCLLCAFHNAPIIEHDVKLRTANTLAINGIFVSGLSISGRDVYLSGPAGSPMVSTQAVDIAREVMGVRVVNVRVTGSLPDTKIYSTAVPDAAADAKTIAIKKATQSKLNQVLRTSIVEFETSSADLTRRGRNTLDQIASILVASPQFFCDINGYTDSSGTIPWNNKLSKMRAVSTKDYLVTKGVMASRLAASGLGDTRPIASNETEDGRQKNRRIEFVVKDTR